MKTRYNTNFKIEAIDQEKYDMLYEFLEDNHISFEETDFEEFIIDERSEDEKYLDWLSEQADLHNDEVKMGLE